MGGEEGEYNIGRCIVRIDWNKMIRWVCRVNCDCEAFVVWMMEQPETNTLSTKRNGFQHKTHQHRNENHTHNKLHWKCQSFKYKIELWSMHISTIITSDSWPLKRHIPNSNLNVLCIIYIWSICTRGWVACNFCYRVNSTGFIFRCLCCTFSDSQINRRK